jgi:hypothetical protein
MRNFIIAILMLITSMAFAQNPTHKVKILAYFTNSEGFRLQDSSYIEIEKCMYVGCGKIVKEHYPDKSINRDNIYYYVFDKDYTMGVAFKEENPNICGSITHWDYVWLSIVYYPRYK